MIQAGGGVAEKASVFVIGRRWPTWPSWWICISNSLRTRKLWARLV